MSPHWDNASVVTRKKASFNFLLSHTHSCWKGLVTANDMCVKACIALWLHQTGGVPWGTLLTYLNPHQSMADITMAIRTLPLWSSCLNQLSDFPAVSVLQFTVLQSARLLQLVEEQLQWLTHRQCGKIDIAQLLCLTATSSMHVCGSYRCSTLCCTLVVRVGGDTHVVWGCGGALCEQVAQCGHSVG